MKKFLAFAALLVAVPAAYADAEFWVITELGGLFQVKPPPAVPTSDVTMSPFIEFRRLGGLIASSSGVTEASQYNDVSGLTYIIGDWSKGDTYGIPTNAPLEGKMSLGPTPHLTLRALVDKNLVGDAWGVKYVREMSGDATAVLKEDGTHGKYLEMTGTGRILVGLADENNFMAHLECMGCVLKTPAVIGAVAQKDGEATSDIYGLLSVGRPHRADEALESTTCTHRGTVYGCAAQAGSGSTHEVGRPLHPSDAYAHRTSERFVAVLNVTKFDRVSCPSASADSDVRQINLNDTHFRLEADGCRMRTFEYRWVNDMANLTDWQPLRPGLNSWSSTSPGERVIAVDMPGGVARLQVYFHLDGHDMKRTLFGNSDALAIYGGIMDRDDIAVLHDSRRHLSMHTLANLHEIVPLVSDAHNAGQLAPESEPRLVGHATLSFGGIFGAPTGEECLPGYVYCITVFDSDDVPRLGSAAGKVYDSKNGVVVYPGSDVGNAGSVFGQDIRTGGIFVDRSVLEVVQSYAVIPISGVAHIEEIYIVWLDSCDPYIDDADPREEWRPGGTVSGQWLRMSYLEGDYGPGMDQTVDIPMFAGYGTICLRQHGYDEFRQFNADDMYTQGASASFGGSTRVFEVALGDATGRHPTIPASATVRLAPPQGDPASLFTVLDGNIPVTATGARTLDMDMEFSVVVLSIGVQDTGSQTPNCFRDKMLRADPYNPTDTGHVEVRNMKVTVTKVSVAGGTATHTPVVTGTYHGVHRGDWNALGSVSLPDYRPAGGTVCTWKSYGSVELEPEYVTVPVFLRDNDHLRFKVEIEVWLDTPSPGGVSGYIGLNEIMRTEVFIDRLTFRVY